MQDTETLPGRQPSDARKDGAPEPVRLPSQIPPERLVAVVDTREQRPLDLAPLRTITGTLATGDYSLLGLEHVVAVERKSLDDLLGAIGRYRARFDREAQRLLAYPCRALVIEGSWSDLESGQWRSDLTPAQALGSVLGWVALGLPVIMAGDHEAAGRFVSRLLYIAARRRWREARALVGHVLERGGSD